ncbi:MAG: hemolysin III family protein [Dehalococcoidia bacterium]
MTHHRRVLTVHALPGFAEPFSALTHLVGAIVFAILGWVLVKRAGAAEGRVPVLVFSLSAVTLLAVSGVTHMFMEGGTPRGALSRIDGAAIFVLIAGTHTGVHGIFFTGSARTWPLLCTWLLVGTAIAILTLFQGLVATPGTILIYLVFGWGTGLTGVSLVRRLGIREMVLPLLGGLTYSAGSVLLLLGQPHVILGAIGPHEIWHLAVITGLSAYWLFLYRNMAQGTLHGLPTASLHAAPDQPAGCF